VGAAATETAQAHMVERLAQFKSSLEAFALKYRYTTLCAALSSAIPGYCRLQSGVS
jgi:hypothetical protein